MTEVSSTPSPDELAMQVARKMYEEDKASQHLGMALKEIAPGKAVMTMRVTEQMLNGHKTCHGGISSPWQIPHLPSPVIPTIKTPWLRQRK